MNRQPQIWKVGDLAIYVAGPPTWRDYVGQVVAVRNLGWNPEGRPTATIERIDTGEKTAVRACSVHTNIRPLEVMP